MYIANAVYISFKELKTFKKKIFKTKFYFLAKEQGYRRPINNLKYFKGLISDPKYKDNPVDKTSSTSLLTNYGSKGCFKNGNGATTP